MFKTIDLKIYSPTEMLLDEEVRRLTFNGKEGLLTILPNHIDYVSSFTTNIMSYIDKSNNKKFIALNNGILLKYSNKVRLTAYKAIIGDSLEDLKEKIDKTIDVESNIQKEINKNLKQLEYYMFNNLINMK